MTLAPTNFQSGFASSINAPELNAMVQICPNVAALRQFIGVYDQTIFLAGTTTASDGGQGLYTFTLGSAADNGSSVIVPTGVYPPAYWKQIPFNQAGTGGSTITSQRFVANGAISGSQNTGAYSYGTLNYSDVNILQSLAANANGYAQSVLVNQSAGASASSDFIVGNNQTTATTFYGDFGMNSSNFTGSGSLNLANAVYLYAANGDLVLGTYTSNGIRFVVNNGATDAGGFSSSGAFSLGTPLAASSGGTGYSTGVYALGVKNTVNVTSPPSSYGNENSINTAFTGDLSSMGNPVAKSITGATTAGQPATGYFYPWQISPYYTYVYNTSGWNQSTSGNDGRTAVTAFRTKVDNYGQGDMVAYNATGFVSGARAGATDFLANPAVSLFNGDMTAGSAGVYLNPYETYITDGGFDVAGVGLVSNFNRTNATGALHTFWAGCRIQSVGSQPIDQAFGAVGPTRVGLDFSGATFQVSGTWTKAASCLPQNARIYGNSVYGGGSTPYTTSSTGTDWIERSSFGFWNFVYNNTSVLQVSDAQIIMLKPMGYATGAGAAVTQATNKSTGVTLNAGTGQITMNNAALAAGGAVAFTMTNAAIGANDVVNVSISSGATTLTYRVQVEAMAAGSCRIAVQNYSASPQSEAIVLQFVLIKGAIA